MVFPFSPASVPVTSSLESVVNIPPKTKPTPLSSLVDELFGVETPSLLPPLKIRFPVVAATPPPPSDVFVPHEAERILSHLYQGPIRLTLCPPPFKTLGKMHSNFVDCFGLVNTREKLHLVLFRDNDLTLRSFTAFNRHALRKAPSTTPSCCFMDSDFETEHGDKVPIPPFLLGSDPLLDGVDNDLPLRFLFYQCLEAVDFLHQQGIVHGNLSPECFTVTNDFWVEMKPPIALARKESELGLSNDTELWRRGLLSNFDYLMNLNLMSGRRSGGLGSFYAVLPWVIDFETQTKRDLTRTKYRLKKGEKQLHATFGKDDNEQHQVRHHIPESLSELTYCVYTARKTPLSRLMHVVRPIFEPKEYPSSMGRLFEWTPDECIPEFFIDAQIFHPRNQLKCLLCSVGQDDHSGENETEEANVFLAKHLEALETCSEEGMATWIDLTFGSNLSGRLAVDSLNVVLSPRSFQGMEDPFTILHKAPEFVRLFDRPHPTRKSSSPTVVVSASTPSATHHHHKEEVHFLQSILNMMLAPRGGLKLIQLDNVSSTFLGSDLVEWLLVRGISGVDSIRDAVSLAQRMMALGFFQPAAINPTTTTTTTTTATATTTTTTGAAMMENDFVDADDCAYKIVFRGGSHAHSSMPTHKNDIFERANAQLQMEVDAKNAGLLRMKSYYHDAPAIRSIVDDLRALALIVCEVYLGRPMVGLEDLDGLPKRVGDGLRWALMATPLSPPVDLCHKWRREVFPVYFHVVHAFLSRVRLASTQEEIDVFVNAYPSVFSTLPEDACWLTYPLAKHLFSKHFTTHFKPLFTCMHTVLGEKDSFQSFINSVLASASGDLSLATHWISLLPVDSYLEHFVSCFVHASASNTNELVAVLERRLPQTIHIRTLKELLIAKCGRLAGLEAFFRLMKFSSPPSGVGKKAFSSSSTPLSEDLENEEVESSGEEEPSLMHSNWSASSNSQLLPKRNVHTRYLAHLDAPVTCMTASIWPLLTHKTVAFCTASRRGEVAAWSFTSGEIGCLARSRLCAEAIHVMRMTSSSTLLAGTIKRFAVSVFDVERNFTPLSHQWIPNIRSVESYARRSDLAVLGGTMGDVLLADFRLPSHQIASRFALPRHGQNKNPCVRCVLPRSDNSLVCAMQDSLFELDPRMMGRVCREWSAGSGNVTKLAPLSNKQLIVSVMKGGNLASVWDMQHKEAKIRLRAIAGFNEPNKYWESEAEDFDSLVAFSEAEDSLQYMYVVRGSHKISRVPLAVLEEPKEVRVQPLSLIHSHAHLGNRRYKAGHLCLTSLCVLPSDNVLVGAGHDLFSAKGGFQGSYLHVIT